MAKNNVTGSGTKQSPWLLKTPSGSSEYQMYRDESLSPPALVCTVGKTVLRYDLRCLDDLHAMLTKHGAWMSLGSADETEAGGGGHRRSLGPLVEEPGRRLVWAQERLARPVWNVRSAADGGWDLLRSSTTPRTIGCARSRAEGERYGIRLA